MDRRPLVFVAGDVTIDWRLARTRALPVEWHDRHVENSTRLSCQPGGAVLLGSVIRAAGDAERDKIGSAWDVRGPIGVTGSIAPGDSHYSHAHTVWERHPRLAGGSERSVWRVAEYLGLDRSTAPALSSVLSGGDGGGEEINLLVLNDSALGFRDAKECWELMLQPDHAPSQILLKMSSPVLNGQLWEFLSEKVADRLIVVLSIEDVRRSEVQISRAVSWERTAEDLARELVYNPRLNSLRRCAHVVISLGPSGALRYSPETKAVRLTFDPSVIEGEWAARRPGGIVGSTTCMAASLAHELIHGPSGVNLDLAIGRGVQAMRCLHEDGYDGPTGSAHADGISFPTARVVEAMMIEKPPFSVVDVPDPVRAHRPLMEGGGTQPGWSIARVHYKDALRRLARDIVLKGMTAVLSEVPVARYGKLVVIDRDEIEGYRTTSALMQSYCATRHVRQPLCVAVFGTPGSGKSFGIEQVAKSLLPGEIEKLTFNLSQFRDPSELAGAFHQVRDVSLSGKVPLVFWDEFDTTLAEQPLGWLRYFLAPMQDGTFQEGQITHPIGRAIFVFAGGTSYCMASFDRGSQNEMFQRAKGPDFISRLKGFVNVLGPNRRSVTPNGPPAPDPYYVVRRAMLFRSILERDASQLFEHSANGQFLRIDPGVLRAFLEVPEYRYGARSLEALVVMSALNGVTQFGRSSLPPEDRLNLHVDSKRFSRLVLQIEPTDDQIENLAEQYHEDWRANRLAEHWTYAEIDDDVKKTHHLLRPYGQLAEPDKEKNRAAVRQIPMKLAEAGYIMVPTSASVSPIKFSEEEVERMARLEHLLWCEGMVANSYQVGEPTLEDPYRNPHIVAWDDLPPFLRETNCTGVRAFPRILASAGFLIEHVALDKHAAS